MIKYLGLVIFCIGLISCSQNKNSDSSKNSEVHKSKLITSNIDTYNALKFIGTYTDSCMIINQSSGLLDWINSNRLVTTDFKIKLTQIIKKTNEADSEMGLGFDPILNAQDFPEDGYEVELVDSVAKTLIIQGKTWKDFKVKMKLKYENEEWLVDGCGIINITEK